MSFLKRSHRRDSRSSDQEVPGYPLSGNISIVVGWWLSSNPSEKKYARLVKLDHEFPGDRGKKKV